MEEELISKKELLKVTGISYGQLYRWKRKKLIPEEWFIKKSSFTGQETFFPKEKILTRIDKIVNLKDDTPLDEIAQVFSTNISVEHIEIKDIEEKNIVSKIALNLYKELGDNKNITNFKELLFIYIMDKFLIEGSATIEECKEMLKFLRKFYDDFLTKQCDVCLIRKYGVSIYFLIQSDSKLVIEENAKLIMKVNTAACSEELKLKISNEMGGE